MHRVRYRNRTILITSGRLASLALIISFFFSSMPRLAEAASGDLDPTFGTGGKTITDFFGSVDGPFGVVIQPDGKSVVGGFAVTPNQAENFAVARYKTDGTLDSTFGSGGKVTTDFSGASDQATAIALQNDGKIILAGLTLYSIDDINIGVARYNSDGSLDTSFGSGGKVVADFDGSENQIRGIAIQSDGKIVLAGYRQDDKTFTSELLLVRFNSNGSLDATFGTGGRVITNLGGNEQAYDVIIEPDGHILAAGNGTLSFGLLIVRYNSDGSIDTNFASGGKISTNLLDVAYSIALDSNGKILAGGDYIISGLDFGLVRFNSDGSLDTTFGSGGLVSTDFMGGDDIAFDMVVQPDGSIVLGGVHSANLFSSSALARYTSDGMPDTSFGDGGKVITNLSPNGSYFSAIASQSDGKIIAVGLADFGESANFGIARYQIEALDFCLQDEFNGSSLQIDSGTGEFLFTQCGTGLTIAGTGVITVRGCITTLKYSSSNVSVSASVDTCSGRGSASIVNRLPRRINIIGISDQNIADNTCICP